jgi:hypothetical protein
VNIFDVALQVLKEAVISSVEYQGVPSLPDVPSNGSLDCSHGLALGEGQPDVFEVTGGIQQSDEKYLRRKGRRGKQQRELAGGDVVARWWEVDVDA